MTPGTLASPSAARPVWAAALSLIALILVMLAWAGRDAVKAAVEVWVVSPTYTHCFLVPPIAAWLLWRRREALQRLAPVPTPLPLLLGGPAAVLLFWLGGVADVNEVRQGALMLAAQLVLWSVLGHRIYRMALVPCLYLFLAVPFGAYLVPTLQDWTTGFVDRGLGALSIPHVRMGNIIEAPSGRFEVEEACAGLRFLIATLTLGVLFCILNYRSPARILAFMMASVVLPIVANWVRALMVVLIAYESENRFAVGFDHIVYGWGFSVGILLLLFWIGGRYREAAAGEAPDLPDRIVAKPSRLALAATLFACLAQTAGMAAAANGEFEAHTRPDAADFAPLREGARGMAATGWRYETTDAVWTPLVGGPAGHFHFRETDPLSDAAAVDGDVFLFVGGEAPRQAAQALQAPWDGEIWRPVTVAPATTEFGDSALPIREALIATVSEHRLVWLIGRLGGRYVLGGLDFKLAALRASIAGPEGAAMMALSTRIGPDEDETRARARLGRFARGFGFAGPAIDQILSAPNRHE